MLYALFQLWMDGVKDIYMLYAQFQLWVDGVRGILCAVFSVSAMDGWCEEHFMCCMLCFSYGWMV